MAGESTANVAELNVEEALAEPSLNLDGWTTLISNVEKRYPDDIDKISLVYNSFLSKFSLCCGYWRKYADHKARLCAAEQVVEVYEEAVGSVSYSVDIWVDYCSFYMSAFEDPEDVRRLFIRGLSFVRKDYLCHTLWDKYIEFEFSQQHWNSLAHIYIEVLKFPTKKLHQYYDSFKKLVVIWNEEMGGQNDSVRNPQANDGHDEETAASRDYEISLVIEELQDPWTRLEALQKYLSIGEIFYQKACELDSKLHHFELNACASHFCMEPLSEVQLENWHQYLDFVEGFGDFDWAVKLYERCLICCAGCPELWIRYVEYVESRGGRELANDALERANYFTKNAPAIQLFRANFKEQIRDVSGAHEAFLKLNQYLDSYFIDRVTRKANMERRLGNYVAACDVFREAITIAEENRPDALPTLYIRFSRLQYMITNCVDAARSIIVDGVCRVPHCKLLLEELMRITTGHMGAEQVKILDPIIANAIMPLPESFGGLDAEDREDISRLYMEFVDLHGTIYESRNAWNRHMRLFPQSLRADLLKQPARDSVAVSKAVDGESYKCVAHPQYGTVDSTINSQTLPLQVARNSMDDTCRPWEGKHELLNETNDHTDIVQADRESEEKKTGLRKDPHRCEEENPPSLEHLFLHEQDDGSHDQVISIFHVHESHQETTVSNVQVDDSAHRNLEESSSHLSTLRDQSRHHKDPDDKKWPWSSKDGSSKCHSFWRNPEERGQQICHVSPWRRGSDWCADDKHRQENSRPPQRRSRWSPLEVGKSLSPQRCFSPNGRAPSKSYVWRNHHELANYYDSSRTQRRGRVQNDRWKRNHNVENPTRVSSTQTPGHFVADPQQAQAVQVGHSGQQNGEQPCENMQSSQQAYNQMWQVYYSQQQQWQEQLLQQQQNQQPFQLQSQQQLQMQSHELVQFQYQQWQLYQGQQQQTSQLQNPNQEQHTGEQEEDNQQPQSGTQPPQTYESVHFQQPHVYQQLSLLQQKYQQQPQMQLPDQMEQAGQQQQDSQQLVSDAQTVPAHQTEQFQHQQQQQQQKSHLDGSSEAMEKQLQH